MTNLGLGVYQYEDHNGKQYIYQTANNKSKKTKDLGQLVDPENPKFKMLPLRSGSIRRKTKVIHQ